MKIDPSGVPSAELYRLLIAAIVPRPIAFLSTVSAAGVANLAPFSFFNGVSSKPPLVSVSISTRRWQGQIVKKDSLRNIEETGGFVINVATERLLGPMNQSAAEYPPEVSEFDEVGLTPIPSERVAAPRVKESPVQLECKLYKIIPLGEPALSGLVLGEVVMVHVEEAVLSPEGGIDPEKLQPIARLGGTLYATLGTILSLPRPEWKPPSTP